ncbi:hypothetical protein [Hyphococcus sp.]|uniref:hypothetical protein n=1 Tax=Hyphococcus sp. TaxID=2038636 RepID=UPI003CCBF397
MKKYSIMLLLLIIGCTHNVSRDYVNDRGCDYYGKSFCITAPHLDHVFITSPVIDFFMYSLQSDGRLLLSIYEGNHSQKYETKNFTDLKIDGMSIKTLIFDDGETIHTYYINDAIAFPSEIHIQRPKNLPLRVQEEIIRVEESIRFCAPQDSSMICISE